MPLVNALLVRHSHGTLWVVDAASVTTYGRVEAYLELGAAGADEAARVGLAVLAERAAPVVAVSAGLEPAGAGDAPYVDFAVGDRVTVPAMSGPPELVRVVALSVTEDDEGNPVFSPELHSLRDERVRALERSVKRMSNGTLAGSTDAASPAGPPARSDITPRTEYVPFRPIGLASTNVIENVPGIYNADAALPVDATWLGVFLGEDEAFARLGTRDGEEAIANISVNRFLLTALGEVISTANVSVEATTVPSPAVSARGARAAWVMVADATPNVAGEASGELSLATHKFEVFEVVHTDSAASAFTRMRLRMPVGQTTAPLEIRDSANTVVFRVNADGTTFP